MTVVMDGSDIDRLANFWCGVLGFYRRPPVSQFIVLRPTDPDERPHLILQQVPEGKVVKNRAHLDLHVPDIAAARDRFIGLGARLLQEEPNCIGSHCWYLMADPEGNEFCVAPDH
jgi:predicted enzyme related to lactoylglutathione lyase